MNKKIVLIFISISILSIIPASYSQGRIGFVITNISQLEFQPSESTTLTIMFENIGSGDVEELFSTIDTSGLPIRNLGESTKYIGSLRNYPQANVSYNLYIDEFAVKGIYTIPIFLHFKTVSKQPKADILNISVRVVGSRNIAKVEVTEIKTPSSVYPGNIVDIGFNIKNVGKEDADRVTLALILDYPFSSIGNLASKFINQLRSNDSKILNFSLGIDSLAEPGLYDVGVNLDYFSKNVAISSANNSFGVEVKESIGILDISKVSIKGGEVKPGDIFELEFVPKNLGTEPLENINIRLLPKPPFGSIEGVPEAFINSLEHNEVGRAIFKLNVDRVAPTKQFYPMDFEVEYTSRNKKFEKNGTFTIPVKGQPIIYIQEIIIEPNRITTGSEGLMLVRIINAGTERAEDLKIKVSGGENILTESYHFIGGLEIDSLETSTFGIYVNPGLNPGVYALDMAISYKDRYGNEYSNQKTSELSIFKASSIMKFVLLAGGFIGFSLIIFLIITTAKAWVAKK
jgi:hypothetical protein